MSDPISDFLNKLKLASRARKDSFTFSSSRMISAIVAVLEKKGYIESSKKTKKGHQIEIKLPSGGKALPITSVRRMSRLSKRMYIKAREIQPIRNGSGTAVLSTPKGVLLDKDARNAKVGGEVLFEIW